MSIDRATCGKSELNVLIIVLVKRPRYLGVQPEDDFTETWVHLHDVRAGFCCSELAFHSNLKLFLDFLLQTHD